MTTGKMTTKKSIALITAFNYTLIMAIGMFTMHFVMKLNYDNPKMVYVLFYFEIIMSILTIVIYRKFFRGSSFIKKKEKPRRIFKITFSLMVIGLVAITLLQLTSAKFSSDNVKLLFMTFITTSLVGLSEELMYRGIVLPAFSEYGSKAKGIIISAGLFSALHGVNVLGGSAFSSVLIQLVTTFFVGIVFACIATEFKNILPLIIFHGLWDFVAIGGPIISNNSLSGIITGLMIAFEGIMGLVILFFVIRKDRQPDNN